MVKTIASTGAIRMHTMNFLTGIGTATQLAATRDAEPIPTLTGAGAPTRPRDATWPQNTKIPSRHS